MANVLLDFVISLLRNPDAAARYAADPAQALTDAGLEDVTSADVDNLIPVVVESLSMTAPSHGLVGFGAEAVSNAAGNVWASGAATAAFDAFDDHLPASAASPVADEPESGISAVSGGHVLVDILDEMPDDMRDNLESLQPAEPAAQAVPPVQDHFATETGAVDDGVAEGWAAPVADPEPGDHRPGFDNFD